MSTLEPIAQQLISLTTDILSNGRGALLCGNMTRAPIILNEPPELYVVFLTDRSNRSSILACGSWGR
jgi:hypothetical protein